MTVSDPLSVLLMVKKEMGVELEDELIRACYEIQSAHQYDKERDTIKMMKDIVEDKVTEYSKGLTP